MPQSNTVSEKTGVLITGPQQSQQLAEELSGKEIQTDFIALEESSFEGNQKITFKHLEPAIKKVAKTTEINLIIGLDEANNKLAIAVRKKPNGVFVVLNTNQITAIIVDALIERLDEGQKLHVIQSIHISYMIEDMVKKSQQSFERVIVAPGKIEEVVEQGKDKGDVVFGVTENQEFCFSDGGIKGLVQLISGLEAHMRENNHTLFDRLIVLYGKHGFYKERTFVRDISSKTEKKHAKEIMDVIRRKPTTFHPAFELTRLVDYNKGMDKNFLTGKELDLPFEKNNILELHLADGAQITLEPGEDFMNYHITIAGDTINDKNAYTESNTSSQRRIAKLMENINRL